MLIATVRNEQNEVVYLSESGPFSEVWKELKQAFTKKEGFMYNISDDASLIYFDSPNNGHLVAELEAIATD